MVGLACRVRCCLVRPQMAFPSGAGARRTAGRVRPCVPAMWRACRLPGRHDHALSRRHFSSAACSGTSLGRLCNVGFISRHHRRRRLEEADPSGSVFDTGWARGVRFTAANRRRESGRSTVFRYCVRQNGNHRERPQRSCHSGNRDSCGFARSTGVVFESGLSATIAGRLTNSDPDGRNTASASFFWIVRAVFCRDMPVVSRSSTTSGRMKPERSFIGHLTVDGFLELLDPGKDVVE